MTTVPFPPRLRAEAMSTSLPASRPFDDASRAVGRWLVAFAIMVLAIIVVGGATRLTESGLSITEWKPVSGVIPPLSSAAWAEEFAKYQRIPQYERLNAGMSLAEFRAIYLWEYGHRLIARLVGLAFVLPLAWFTLRRRMPAIAARRVWLLLALLLAQGAMGWWMVKSGLSVRTEVSQYRLAAHLLVALVILAITVWTAADLLAGPRRTSTPRERRDGRLLAGLAGLVFFTSASGALVAGLRAGKVYNTFPLMGGRIVPDAYGQLSPGWLNAFENHAAVQFNHRVLAVVTVLAALGAWTLLRGSANRRLATAARLVAAVALLQLSLGITTLLLAVPVALGVAHQGTAALLLAAVVLAWQANGRGAGEYGGA
jgi:cytochrome c oxidase assembly protein subunit 15